jgi:transposase
VGRGQRGTKYHVAVAGAGVPVACAATAAILGSGPRTTTPSCFERLFLTAFAVLARIRTVFADKGYDAEPHRELRRAFGVEPRLHRRGRPHGSGLGRRRRPVERSNAWILENERLALRYDRLGVIVQSLLQAACLFLVAPRLAREL